MDELRTELDPFLNESRAFEHINRFCPSSCRIYFPRFYGVITDLDYSKYPSRYKLRRRAVVLEAIKPELASRRILAAETLSASGLVEEFSRRLRGLSLCLFEMQWYESLFENRIRRITALYDIGITHGDIRDDHFRLRGDFYDTVLHDFSVSYTFSPTKRPYLVSFRKPRPLEEIKSHEQRQVQEQVFKRLGTPVSTVMTALICV